MNAPMAKTKNTDCRNVPSVAGFMGLNVAQPFVQFQTSIMRVFAENMEPAARNYEKSFEAVNNIIAQQQSQAPQ